MPNSLELDISLAVAVVALVISAICLGFLLGFNHRKVIEWLAKLQWEVDQSKKTDEDDEDESAIVDTSPGAVAERRQKRKEEPEDDDGESQIVTTKTPEQRALESTVEKEAKLDKWMPGVKHGK